jgi:hypothetical protein
MRAPRDGFPLQPPSGGRAPRFSLMSFGSGVCGLQTPGPKCWVCMRRFLCSSVVVVLSPRHDLEWLCFVLVGVCSILLRLGLWIAVPLSGYVGLFRFDVCSDRGPFGGCWCLSLPHFSWGFGQSFEVLSKGMQC